MLTTAETTSADRNIRRFSLDAGEHADKLTALHDLVTSVGSSLDLDRALCVALEKILKLTGADAGSIRLIDPATNQLGTGLGRGISHPSIDQIVDSSEYDEYAVQVLKLEKACVLSVIREDKGINHGPPAGFQALIWIPLKTQDKAVGILCLGHRSPRSFPPDEIAFLERVGVEAGAAIHNALSLEQMRHSKEEAEKAVKLKSDFLGTMSHELRTPLHVIMSNTALLSEGMCGELNEAQKRRLKLIERNANDLLRLVQGILDITRLEESKMPIHLEEICVEGILIEVRSEFAGLSRNKDVALEVRKDGAIPAMLTDRVKLKEILHNLMINAVKFTTKGTVELKVRYLEAVDRIEFTVQDTGIGIREEDLPHIFEVFYQVESSNHREFGGTGLGLNIVKQLVKLLQGEIRAESAWGKGSRFCVSLPREIRASDRVQIRSRDRSRLA